MDFRKAVATAAWAFRSLFNLPEVTAPSGARIAPSRTGAELSSTVSTGTSKVLDEYAHVLREALGWRLIFPKRSPNASQQPSCALCRSAPPPSG